MRRRYNHEIRSSTSVMADPSRFDIILELSEPAEEVSMVVNEPNGGGGGGDTHLVYGILGVKNLGYGI